MRVAHALCVRRSAGMRRGGARRRSRDLLSRLRVRIQRASARHAARISAVPAEIVSRACGADWSWGRGELRHGWTGSHVYVCTGATKVLNLLSTLGVPGIPYLWGSCRAMPELPSSPVNQAVLARILGRVPWTVRKFSHPVLS